MDNTFSPIEILQASYQNWWFILLLMLLGSIGGWGFSKTNQPVYETRAGISTSIDFTRTGLLTDVEEDYAIGIVGDVISSPEVKKALLADADAHNLNISPDFISENTFLERRNNLWDLVVRSSNPELASDVANLWAENGYQALEDALQHAIAAQNYYRYLTSLESCLSETVVNEPVYAVCEKNTLAQIQDDMTRTGDLAKQETLASQGILPAMTFTLADVAPVPVRPVIFKQNQLVLSGALIGFLLAIWGVYLKIPDRLPGRHTHV